MGTLKFLAIAILATAVNGASLLSEDARNLANPAPLLRRCPCVPINTCYAQGVSLNEQDFLNTHFECPDYTQNHCCGPYFPTLGSEDFYFDDPAQGKLLLAEATIPGFSNTGERVMIVMAQNNVTTPETSPPVIVTVLPETTTTEVATTTEVEDVGSTTVEVEATTMSEAVTEEPEIVTTTTTTVKPKLRLSKTHSRRVLPRFERKSTRGSTTTTTESSTTTVAVSSSTATTESLRRIPPTRRTLYRSEFRQRLIGSRLRSTTAATATTE